MGHAGAPRDSRKWIIATIRATNGRPGGGGHAVRDARSPGEGPADCTTDRTVRDRSYPLVRFARAGVAACEAQTCVLLPSPLIGEGPGVRVGVSEAQSWATGLSCSPRPSGEGPGVRVAAPEAQSSASGRSPAGDNQKPTDFRAGASDAASLTPGPSPGGRGEQRSGPRPGFGRRVPGPSPGGRGEQDPEATSGLRSLRRAPRLGRGRGRRRSAPERPVGERPVEDPPDQLGHPGPARPG